MQVVMGIGAPHGLGLFVCTVAWGRHVEKGEKGVVVLCVA